MASPQASITTVSGRRCTRSRARTAATSTVTTEEPSVVTPTEFTTSTAVEQAPQIQTSAADPPPPPPPSSTMLAEQPAVAPTTKALVSSAIGTSSLLPISSARNSVLANLALPASAEESRRPTAAPLQVAESPSAAPTSLTPTSSDIVALAVPTTSPVISSIRRPSFTASAASAAQSSVDAVPEQPSQTDGGPSPSSTDTPATEQPQQTTSALASLPSGGSAGMIAPDSSDNDGTLTLPNSGDANIGSIIGGVIGGVAGLALISGLLFFCLRKRKTRAPRWNEKRQARPAFIEKVRGLPAGLGVFFAELKDNKSGPLVNPYQRHATQLSESSVYSTNSNGRPRSTSEPQGIFAVPRGGSVRSTLSKKSERNSLRMKPSSFSSHYRFPSITENGSLQNKGDLNPFADPGPPSNLQRLNYEPTTPLPAVTSDRVSRDPFASLLDQIEYAPDWLQVSKPTPGHNRTQSSASTLRSQAPSSLHPIADNPFADPSTATPLPTQAVLPNQKRRSSIAYSTTNATYTAASRDSQLTFFGEPGPSRPATNMFTPGLPTGRTIRQSDPFDLDRPEVLGFSDVLGRKEVLASVTRQPTESKRASSVGNWANVANTTTYYGPYERDSAKPGPLLHVKNSSMR